MFKIHTLTVTPLQSNCYIIHEEKERKCIIIDPGGDGEFIKQKIIDNNLTPTHILATHGHFDHIGAALDLQLSFNIPFLIHKSDEFLVKRLRETSIHFTGIDPGPPPTITSYLNEYAENYKGVEFIVIPTPGHTPGSVCFHLKNENAIFVGDTIFEGGGVGRTDFAYSSQKDLQKSIQTILKLPPNTILYSGHGKPFLLKDYNRSTF